MVWYRAVRLVTGMGPGTDLVFLGDMSIHGNELRSLYPQRLVSSTAKYRLN